MTDIKLKILHIGSDEKFINAANFIFEEAFPGSNTFIIPHSRFHKKLKYVDLKKNFELVFFGNNLIKTILKETLKYDCIVLHGITEINSSVFLQSQEKSKFIGIIWGAEIYTEENYPGKLLGEKTRSIQLQVPKQTFIEHVKTIIRRIVYRRAVTIENASKYAAKSLSYFCGLDDLTKDLLKQKNIIAKDSAYIPFTYYPIEFVMKGNESARINGNNILIGNSASNMNNHLEAFHLLKELSTQNRRIIVPLSYGDKLYADFIQAKGTELFADCFLPIRHFMPLNEYVKELQHCGITIMNHYRSQAVGNILMMLWLGSKVYLNENNTFFQYLKNAGIKVFSIEKELNNTNNSALDNLSDMEIEHNRELLIRKIGLKNIVTELRNGIIKYFS